MEKLDKLALERIVQLLEESGGEVMRESTDKNTSINDMPHLSKAYTAINKAKEWAESLLG